VRCERLAQVMTPDTISPKKPSTTSSHCRPTMSLQTKVNRRRRALKWFAEQEADPAAALFTERPSTRLCRLMLDEGLVELEPVGQFEFSRWRITPIGHLVAQRKAEP